MAQMGGAASDYTGKLVCLTVEDVIGLEYCIWQGLGCLLLAQACTPYRIGVCAQEV